MNDSGEMIRNEIGGYFALECGKNPPYHKNAIFLNSGCNALRLAIQTYKIKRLFVPNYTCPVVWRAVQAEHCECVFYALTDDFLPQQKIPEQSFVLYNNYFGICARQVIQMEQLYPNLIVDNAQAFYMQPRGIASIYSPRKFFGLPDGGLLLCKKKTAPPSMISESYSICSHLLKRWDLGAMRGYQDFKENDEWLEGKPIERMSALTQALMGNINYATVKKTRLTNFVRLHKELKDKNRIKISLTPDDVPMVYPFWTANRYLRKKLINHKIFVALYWPGIENNIFENLIPLPIDQRYNLDDMNHILKTLEAADAL